MLLFSQHILNAIKEDAVSNYPEECCGFLLGHEKNDQRIITKIISCSNLSENKNKTFLISSRDYIKAERFADENSLRLIGIYHSHPDCLPTPSATDTKAALPHFSYLIVSVFHNTVIKEKCWRLTEVSLFEEEEILMNQNIFLNDKNAHGNYHHTYTPA